MNNVFSEIFKINRINLGNLFLLRRNKKTHALRHCEARSNPENHGNQINHKNQSSDKKLK